MLLLLDNYDSFTYTIADYFAQLHASCLTIRNDAITTGQIRHLHPAAIVLSPGPETPAKAGIMMEVIRTFHKELPILGICLGHQGIGEYFGARLVQAQKIMHGKTSQVFHNSHPVFKNIPTPFEAMRYHSLLLEDTGHTPLQTIAQTGDGEVMAVAHPQYKICGIQFHPESILTPQGLDILKNWMEWCSLHEHL